jgi:hypothetical protein
MTEGKLARAEEQKPYAVDLIGEFIDSVAAEGHGRVGRHGRAISRRSPRSTR